MSKESDARTIALVFFFMGLVFGAVFIGLLDITRHSMQVEAVKREAVKREAAYWHVREDGSTVFMWKPKP